jgi:hypothetical protein
MIAMIAVRAICAPNVGPIELAEKSSPRTPNRSSSADSTRLTSSGGSVAVSTLITFDPSAGSSTSWISASANPTGSSVSRTCSTLAGCSSGVVIRVPDSKSIPKLIPWVEIAMAQISRINPEIEKKYRDAPE